MKYQAQNRMILLDCLRILFPDSAKKKLKKLLREGRVWVAGRLAKIPNRIVEPGTWVEVRRERFVSGNLPHVKVLFEDEHLIVADKKEQFLSVATQREKIKTVFHQILRYIQQRDTKARLYVVHRLDYGTSGLMLFAKSPEAHEKLKELFAGRAIERVYRALVEGHPEPQAGRLENNLAESQTLRVYVAKGSSQGKQAVSHYKVLKKAKTCSLLEVRLHTGRRGQIRVQLAHIGHPIVGDHEYGSRLDPLGRLCLHACKLEFKHPMTGKSVVFESRMPESFLRVLDISP